MIPVFLGLGSNIGDRKSTILSAFGELSSFLQGARLSRLWGSRPLYVANQPDFVNAVATGETELAPRDLLIAVNLIEAAHGRDRSREIPKGPRNLDIDILLYGDLVIQEPGLVVPHAGLRERQFALRPLLDLNPGLRDPSSGVAYSDMAKALPEQGIYLLV